MLIATITALIFLLGGSGTFSFGALMDSFKAAISDDARLDRIEDILDEADNDLEAFNKRVTGDWAEELLKIHRNYDTTREQYQAIFARIDTEREATQRRLIEHRFTIKEMLTPEEWATYQTDLQARSEGKN